ncbi:MAG: 5'-nucleotidase C-terminal domain-containing protein [Anaerolineae bacterium]|nr:5'-nucleotidase C-terminal domain-containing protein [Anaerolineae bacterium]
MHSQRRHHGSLRLMAVLLALLMVAALIVPVSAEQGAPTEDYNLTILHTNDTHANIEPCTTTCLGADLGGVARRATAIHDVEAEGGNVLLVDAGDSFQGTLWFNYYQGLEEAHFMNLLGYDAAAIGNHEFDSGPPALANFITEADFPVLSANIDASAQVSLTGLIEPYTVIDVDGESIGVFGLTTEETSNISSPGPDVVFTDHTAAAEATVATLQGMGVNKIVALTHLGYDVDLPLAAAVSGIDVIVGGHSHTPLGPMPDPQGPYPTVVTSPAGEPVLVVSAWEWGKYLGRLDVTFDSAGVVQSYNGDPMIMDASVQDDPAIAAEVAVWGEPLIGLQNTVVAATDVDLDGERQDVRTQETNLADLICDAMLWQTEGVGSQICITNGGGIRASIQTGDITIGNILTVLPFGNTVATMGLLGSDVIAALENGVSQWNPSAPPGRFAQVGGMRYSFDPDRPSGDRIMSAEVMNPDGSYTPIDPDQVYIVTTNDFLRRGGDGYAVFAENAIDPYDTWAVMADSVVDYIQQFLGGTVTADAYPPGGEGRITQVTPDVERSMRFNIDRDTYIDGTRPSTFFGSDQTMWVGFFDQMRPVVHVPISGIPSDAQVDTAYLYLYVTEGRGFTTWSNSVINSVNAHEVTSPWMPDPVNWWTPWTAPGGDFGPVVGSNHLGSGKIGTWLRLDVTDAVQNMISMGVNYGFIVTSDDNIGVRYGLATKDNWDPSKTGYVRVYYRTYD